MLVNGDTFSGPLARVSGENLGTYAIQQSSLALSPNYALAYAGANIITGGGSFNEVKTAGYIKGKEDFGFFVQYSKSMKNPQGVETTVRSYFDRNGVATPELPYKLRSNAIISSCCNWRRGAVHGQGKRERGSEWR
jgi:hypothetical protein